MAIFDIFFKLAEWIEKGKKFDMFFFQSFHFSGVFLTFFLFLMFWITFYSHPVGDTEVALLQKKIENAKIGSHIFLFMYICVPGGR